MHPGNSGGFIVSPLLVGVLSIALGIPLVLGKVKPNSFYGFQIAKTLNDESVWYTVNRFTGKAFIGSGITTVVSVFAVLWLGDLFALGRVLLQLLGAGVIMVAIAVALIASSVV
ncbi:MAG TPA: SdpI family protein, partial [Terriglobales bacterium]